MRHKLGRDTVTPYRQIDKHSQSAPQLCGAGRAFQRVKAEEWIGKKGAINNSYQATFGEEGWGAKAQQVLGQVSKATYCHSNFSS